MRPVRGVEQLDAAVGELLAQRVCAREVARLARRVALRDERVDLRIVGTGGRRVVEYAEGAVGTLSYSWEVPATAKGLRLSKIYGREGSITFETNGLWVICHGTKNRLYIPGLRDLSGYNAMWADFVRAWKSGDPPLMTLAQARRDLELVERAYASALEAV